MRFFRRFIAGFFGFTRRETNGFLLLLPLVVAIVLSEPVYHMWTSHSHRDISRETALLDSLVDHWPQSRPQSKKETGTYKLFAFDPNEATAAEMKELGFPEPMATRILRYRAKAGKFEIKSDLLKIYGMDSAFYVRLYPYIKLPAMAANAVSHTNEIKQAKSVPKPSRYNLNTMDSVQLKTVYGIGSKLASRIIKYREKLGGFIEEEQLAEVYGLDSTVVNRLRAISFVDDTFQPEQLNINRATEEEFSTHPYISRTMAKSIVAYRFQHGNFANVSEIRKIRSLEESTVTRLLPYLTAEY